MITQQQEYVRPELTPAMWILSLGILIVGFFALGMILTVIRLHWRKLRREGVTHGRLLTWHVVAISLSQALFIMPLILGIGDYLRLIETPQAARWGTYLGALALTIFALVVMAIRLRDRPPPSPAIPEQRGRHHWR